MIIKKDEVIVLKVTKEEKKKMQEYAEKECLTLSAYIRKKCLKK